MLDAKLGCQRAMLVVIDADVVFLPFAHQCGIGATGEDQLDSPLVEGIQCMRLGFLRLVARIEEQQMLGHVDVVKWIHFGTGGDHDAAIAVSVGFVGHDRRIVVERARSVGSSDAGDGFGVLDGVAHTLL